jgi:hypothetical protein
MHCPRKVATSNKMRAHHYAAADRYLRLAETEPTATNPEALLDLVLMARHSI